MLTPGTEIGNYIVEAEIARGGMASLFRVRHRVLGTVHALKVLDADLRASGELRSRFLGEALIGAKLRHPHIVRVTDTISTPEVAGLVMDLIRGPTLEAFIQRQTTPLSADSIRDLFLPILEAIAEAHRAGMVHRDIKPWNFPLLDLPKFLQREFRGNTAQLIPRFSRRVNKKIPDGTFGIGLQVRQIYWDFLAYRRYCAFL